MSTLPTPPTSELEAARASCEACAEATHLYYASCVSCQARQLSRIPILRLRRQALEKRRSDLMASDMQRLTALVAAWFDHDRNNPSKGRSHAEATRQVPPASA